MRKAIGLFVTTLAIALAPAPAWSQAAPAGPPAEYAQIPLRPAPANAQPEIWTGAAGYRNVRNVVAPTLTPVLPDPAKANGLAVIVAPGGAFRALSMDSEGYLVARWLADHGIAAFVLKYRLVDMPRDPTEYGKAMGAFMGKAMQQLNDPKGPQPDLSTPAPALEDAQAAVRLVRSRAAEWKVDPNRVGFVGFSAGAMTALSVGLGDKEARPDFIAPIYPPLVARDVPADAPPMFLAIALDDPLFGKGDLGLIDSWRAAKRPVEAHLYEYGGHGFGMTGRRPASMMWIDQFHAWMKDRGLLKPAK